MQKFEGVANTLFVPLVARINISKRFPEYFYDPKALELEPMLPDDATKGSSEYSNMASVARYYNMDTMVMDYIEKNPLCNVVYPVSYTHLDVYKRQVHHACGHHAPFHWNRSTIPPVTMHHHLRSSCTF